MPAARALVLGLFATAAAQQAGHNEVEGAPMMSIEDCTVTGGCTMSKKPITLDANWRWAHTKDGYQNCYKDDKWVDSICKDPVECAKTCALEAITSEQYRNSYGISEMDGGLNLKFVSKTKYGDDFGSRVYLKEDENSYKMFKLKNREFAMDVDVANLPCGLNGAVYFVEMDERGGLGQGQNAAGAKYGTGYCDAQCPHDVKFISGEANSLNWNATADPPVGHYGVCCMEMDIWEANSMSTAYTPHPCDTVGAQRCEGVVCGDNEKGERYLGACDKDGCDFNSYRMGAKDYYGVTSGFTLDTSKKLTVVTQFITADGTDTGDLIDIKRHYEQDGVVIPNSEASILGADGGDSVTDSFCAAQKNAFGDINDFAAKGGLKKMGESLERGVVLVLSLWDDSKVHMLWLDSSYPTNKPKDEPGVARGPCPGGATSTPTYLRANYPDAHVTFTNLKVGEIGSTTTGSRRLSATYV
mmetsp:Transcript_52811/g.136372  ORF Transcript_52811/g.136372 Transcript_52811/m.136372 type:complete len:470 (+) Transcript_52811:71-1480(+)